MISPILRRGDRPLQTVYDRQKLGRKVGNPVFARIRRASLGAPSRVLDFRQSPEQAVAQGGVLVRSLDRGGLLAVGRQAFACQMDFVILIIMPPSGYLPCTIGWAGERAGEARFS